MRTLRPWPIQIMLSLTIVCWGTGVPIAADSGAHFVHTTTTGNTSDWSTTIDSLLTDNQPTAIVHAISRPDVEGGGAFNDHVIGVWYSDANASWRIFNQDLNSMPVDTEFNLWVPPANASTFVHTATAGNTVEHVTTIDNPLTNNQPNAVLRVTPNFNPGGGAGIYNDHVIGVFYFTGSARWKIFNQDRVAMLDGASFNVTVLPDDPTAFVHTGAGGPNTEIDHPLTNGNPHAFVQVTQNWNPPGSSGVYNDHVIGVFYGFSRWWILNQDLLDMSPGVSFNVSVPSPESALFVHTASAGNIAFNYSLIDNPLTNSNPNARVLATQNRNPNGGGGTSNDNAIGVFYDSNASKWAVFNQDELADMPLGADFNISVPPIDASTFVHTAFAPSQNDTVIDNPLINNNSNVILHATQSWNPGDVGGIYNDHAIGVFYSGSKWKIFNQDLANMPMGASFNVSIPPAGASTFVHTAEAGNISFESTFIDHPVSNGNPNAIVLVTPNWNPNGASGVYHNHSIGVYYSIADSKWAVFNEDLATMTAGPSFNVTVVDPPFFSDGFESGGTSAWSAVAQ